MLKYISLINLAVFLFNICLLSDSSVLELEIQRRIQPRAWLCELYILVALGIFFNPQEHPHEEGSVIIPILSTGRLRYGKVLHSQ